MGGRPAGCYRGVGERVRGCDGVVVAAARFARGGGGL